MSYNILHLSDLHIGDTFSDDVKTLGQEVGIALRDQYQGTLNKIIFSGDIFDKCDADIDQKVKEAILFFEALIGMINDGQEERKLGKQDILFVPGNHDLYTNDKESPWKLIDTFLSEYYEENIPRCYDMKEHMLISEDADHKFLFVGMNSYNYNKMYDRRYAEISAAQIEAADKFLKQDKYADYYKVVFFHHPFYIFTEDIRKDIDGMLRNTDKVLNKLEEWDVNLALHGHKHSARETRIWLRKVQNITVAAAGSIGKNGIQYHSCNIIEIPEDRKENAAVKELVSKNNHRFVIEDMPFRDRYSEGLLRGLLEQKHIMNAESDKSEFGQILEMMNEMYLERKAYKLLLGKGEYLDLLLDSVRYRIEYWRVSYGNGRQEDLDRIRKLFYEKAGTIFGEISDDVKTLLDKKNFVIHRGTKEKLSADQNLEKSFSFILLAVLFTDIYMTFSGYWVKIWEEMETDGYRNGKQCGAVRFYGNSGVNYETYFGYLFLHISCQDAETQETAIKAAYRIRDRFCGYWDCFFSIGIKIKNIIPVVENNSDDSVRCCEMDASVPRMIQLLTGTNIYSSDLVFARELILNAIDAISFREDLDPGTVFSKIITVEIGADDEGGFFRIADCGIGMEQKTIEQYFSTLGKSYYKEYDAEEYGDLSYHAVSNFGIGFLSVLRPCRKIRIHTRHFREGVCYNLEIRDGQDYFLVETLGGDIYASGTEMTCYFKNGRRGIGRDLYFYMKERMLDIRYDIHLKTDIHGFQRDEVLPARKARLSCGLNRIFIPFDGENGKIGYGDADTVCPDDELLQAEYGMLIYLDSVGIHAGKNGCVTILAAGVLMEDAKLEDVLGKHAVPEQLKYNKIVVNFPPDWIDIDVSREKINRFCSGYFEESGDFWKKLACSFRLQMRKYQTEYRETSLAAIAEIWRFMQSLCMDDSGRDEMPVENIQNEGRPDIVLSVCFCGESVSLSVSGDGLEESLEKKGGSLRFGIDRQFDSDDGRRRYSSLVSSFKNISPADAFIRLAGVTNPEDRGKELSEVLTRTGFYGWEGQDERYLPLLLSACIDEKMSPDRSDTDIMVKTLIEMTVMENCTLGSLGKEAVFSAMIADKTEVRWTMKSRKLESMVRQISEDCGADKQMKKYVFIWKKVIHAVYKKYYKSDERWEEIENAGQINYRKANEKVKNLYASNTKAKIDIYMIASCYMDALLNIPDILLPVKSNDLKCRWVLDCGVRLVYILTLSEYKRNDQDKYVQLKNQKNLKWPEGRSQYKRYLKLLARKNIYLEPFDILGFSELLLWLAEYNEMILSGSLKKESI